MEAARDSKEAGGKAGDMLAKPADDEVDVAKQDEQIETERTKMTMTPPTVSPVTQSILAQALTAAVAHTDPKQAFDMMLLSEHVKTQETTNHALKEETRFLKKTLATQRREQSEMFHYFHDKTDEHVTRIAELERALEEAQDELAKQQREAHETLEREQQARAAERTTAQEQLLALREELRHVHAFAEAKRELEAHTRSLETKLDAQRAAFTAQVQDLERNNLLEQARAKQELLTRMQATKTELLVRTRDQVASTAHRTLLENEHFTQELAFQSREAEHLLRRLQSAQDEAAQLRARNRLLEDNERLLAKKNRYYHKILTKTQKQMHQASTSSGSGLQLQAVTGAEDVDAGQSSVEVLQTTKDSIVETTETDTLLLAEKRALETQLQRAMDWLRVFQRERQFLVAQQDEVVQFLCSSLDEATDVTRRAKCDKEVDVLAPRQTQEQQDASSVSDRSVNELLQLAPSITTMDAFGRRVLADRPALDELASSDSREVLLFLLEKMRLYQARVAAVYPSTSSPKRELLARQLGVELPPLALGTATALSSSPLKQRRCTFAHVSAAVDAAGSNLDSLGPGVKTRTAVGQLSSPRAHLLPEQLPHAPVSPQLLAMATNQLNFLAPSVKPKRSPVKKRTQISPNKVAANSPARRTQQVQAALSPSSSGELLAPWAGSASMASLTEWQPPSD